MAQTSSQQSETNQTPYSARLAQLFSGLALREDRLFFALAIVIGILAGLAVVGFRIAIDRSSSLLLGAAPSHSESCPNFISGAHEPERLEHDYTGDAQTARRGREGRNDIGIESTVTFSASTLSRSSARSGVAIYFPISPDSGCSPRGLAPAGRRDFEG